MWGSKSKLRRIKAKQVLQDIQAHSPVLTNTVITYLHINSMDILISHTENSITLHL